MDSLAILHIFHSERNWSLHFVKESSRTKKKNVFLISGFRAVGRNQRTQKKPCGPLKKRSNSYFYKGSYSEMLSLLTPYTQFCFRIFMLSLFCTHRNVKPAQVHLVSAVKVKQLLSNMCTILRVLYLWVPQHGGSPIWWALLSLFLYNRGLLGSCFRGDGHKRHGNSHAELSQKHSDESETWKTEGSLVKCCTHQSAHQTEWYPWAGIITI